MNVRAIKTDLFTSEDDLAAFVIRHVPKLPDGAVLAVTSKIVALAERRVANAADKKKIVRRESERIWHGKYGALTLKDGLLMWEAGVDESNADGKLVLLPRSSFAAAAKLRSALKKRYRVKKLGIVVTDSRCMPLRAGVTAVALGYAGFRGLCEYRGTRDLFGRELAVTSANVADSLATAAALCMGEGAERCPLALITDAPVEFAERVRRGELTIAPEDDMYAPVLRTSARRTRTRKKRRARGR